MKKMLLISVLLMALVLTGCAQSQPATDTNNEEMNETESTTEMKLEAQTPPELTEAQTKQLEAGKADHETTTLTFDVTGGNFYYAPNEIRVKQGDTVKIIFTNAGGYHNFVLDEFNVKFGPINGGESKTVEFVADKIGAFEFYCSVGKHRQMGQKGTLIVE